MRSLVRAPPSAVEAGKSSRWARVLVCVGLLLNALFVASPLYRRPVLGTRDQDLATHVRNIHEYTLALREGQLPPREAPRINGSRRYPLFQYYSGTAYLVPGADNVRKYAHFGEG